MNFGEMVTTALLSGLVIFAIITIVITNAEENKQESLLTQAPELNKVFKNLSAQLNESTTNAQAKREAFENENNDNIFSYGFFFLRSMLDTVKVFMSMTIGVTGAVFTLGKESLDISPIVLGTITAIILVSLVLAGWRLYKTGD